MQFLFDAMASLLALFYSVIPNYAVSIVLLTLLVMVVLTPLTLKGTRSMMMMQQLQPEMRKIQNRYKDDRQKLNEELLKFYKENNINPMGGCLPLFAQMPVFFVLYAVLRGLTRRVSDVGYAPGWVTGQLTEAQLPTTPPDLMLNFDPAYIKPETDLYQSLSQVNVMEAFGLDLSESASQALSISILEALPYLVLIALVAVTGYVQQKQIQGRIPKNQVNPQQQMLMKITPIMLPVFSFGLPGGLVLYFLVSNLYRIGQQWFISRTIYGIKRGETIDDKRAREGDTVTAKVKGEKTESVKGQGAAKALDKGSATATATKPKASAGSGRSSSSPSRGRGGGSTPSKAQQQRKKSPAKDQAPAPVLQPRARKNKKR